jgi:hypothetical protein
MPVTSQLGSENARFGNIQLGNGNAATIFEANASDALTLTETWLGYNLHQTIPETLTFSDLASGFAVRGQSIDVLTFTDLMFVNTILERSATDSLTFSEFVVNTKYGDAEDDLTFTDDATGVRRLDFTAPDTLTFTDLTDPELIALRVINEGLNFTEVLGRNLIRLRELSETLVFTETNIGHRVYPISDTLVFDDDFEVFVSKRTRDLLEFDSIFQLNAIFDKKTADVFEMFDAISLNTFMRITVTDSVIFVDTMQADRVTPMSDSITFTDSTAGVASKSLTDSISIVDFAGFSFVKTVEAEDVIVFEDNDGNVQVSLEVERFLEETLAFSEMMRAVLWKFGVASDTFTFSDLLVREVFAITVPDSLTFTDDLTCQKIAVGNPVDTLVLSDSVFVNIVTLLTLNDTLKFVEYRPTNNEPSSSIPLPGIPTNPSPGDPPAPDIPSGTYATVANKMMIFIGQERSVVITPPEFNDYVSDRNQTIFKRKMSGAVTTFIKTSPDEKLHWEFIVSKPKADEFRAFLDAENGRAFTVYDWEGHIWAAKLLTDTIDKEEISRWDPAGNKTRIVVELLGRRYA